MEGLRIIYSNPIYNLIGSFRFGLNMFAGKRYEKKGREVYGYKT